MSEKIILPAFLLRWFLGFFGAIGSMLVKQEQQYYKY